MADYPLTWADIWLLQAIRISFSLVHATNLESIIAHADGINHAVPTFAEFNNAVYKLMKNGLLSSNEGNLAITNTAQALFNKYPGQSYLKQNESIRKALGVEGYTDNYDPNIVTVPDLYISKGRFNNAVIRYQKGYGF